MFVGAAPCRSAQCVRAFEPPSQHAEGTLGLRHLPHHTDTYRRFARATLNLTCSRRGHNFNWRVVMAQGPFARGYAVSVRHPDCPLVQGLKWRWDTCRRGAFMAYHAHPKTVEASETL